MDQHVHARINRVVETVTIGRVRKHLNLVSMRFRAYGGEYFRREFEVEVPEGLRIHLQRVGAIVE